MSIDIGSNETVRSMKKTIIIIHEIYGITENLLLLKDKLEQRGYSVLLPSLYPDNYSGNDEEISYNKFYSEMGIEKGYRDIDSLIAGIHDSELYIVGFSAGAVIAWLHSSNISIKAIIGIYGSRIRDYLDFIPSVKSYLFFCEEKTFDIYPVIEMLSKKNNVNVRVISGSHGFYNSSDAADKVLISLINDYIFRIIEN